MATITSPDGTPIAFEQTGSGPPLVLVHGTTADHTRWEPVRSALGKHCTVYTLDRRGRGESGDAETYALEREFEDVAAVVDSIDDPVHLLGHSHGALCSLEAALRTDNLRSLILYEPPIPWEIVGQYLYPEDVLAEMATFVDAGDSEQALILFLEEVAALTPAELDALRSAPNWQARVDAVQTVLRELPAVAEYTFDASRFEGLTIPTLLLSGGESPTWAHDATDALNAALSNSRIAVLEGQGHAAMSTAPALFIDTVVSFIHESR